MKNILLKFRILTLSLSFIFYSLGAFSSPTSNNGIADIHINNSFISLNYNSKTKSLEATSKAMNKVFLKNLIPNGGTSEVKKDNITDAVFGKGTSLVINTNNGGKITFSLFPSQPFLFITQTLKNEGSDVLDIQKLNPVSFSIELGKPATTLKTLGTGGLLAPDKNPGSYVFLTTVDPSTRNGVVAGWLTNEKGSGVLFSEIADNKVKIKAQIDYGHFRIPSGKTEMSETLLIGYFDDARIGEELFAESIAKNQHIVLKPRTAVYCTWYAEKNGGAGSEKSSIELADFIRKNLKSYGLGTLQIDDMWQSGGKFAGPRRGFDSTDPKGGYPNGMSTTGEAIKKDGLTAGIWWMPFSRNHQDPAYKDRQDWFAYRTNGQPYETAWGGTSLDLTNPEVQQNIASTAKRMHDWGYDYFKMDGLWTGTVTEQVYINDGYIDDKMGNNKPLFDPFKTQIEAYRDGLKILRKAVNNEVFFSGCAVSQNMRSFGASIGLVDAMRIGPDYNHDGLGIKTGPLRASRLYFMNGRIWWNDPDPSVIRELGASTADASLVGIGPLIRARLLPSFVAVSGQFFLSSDWLPDLPEDRLDIMKRTMASHTGIARPVDAFDEALPSMWLAKDNKTGTSRNVIGLFNWDKETKKVGNSLEWIGLKEGTEYYAFDFWKNRPLANLSKSISEELPGESAKVIAVRAKSNHPVIVSTSQHVTQGMIDLLDEQWKNGTLSATSKLIGGDDYEVRIAGLNDGGKWKPGKVEVIGNPKDVTIEVLPQTEAGWQRILIKSKSDQVVKWKMEFKK